MLKIRQGQIDAMSSARRSESAQAMAAELRETAPHAVARLSDVELLDAITNGMDKAQRYGIKERHAVTAFVELAVFAGADFDEKPEVQAFLRAPELDLDFKIALLARLVGRELEQHA